MDAIKKAYAAMVLFLVISARKQDWDISYSTLIWSLRVLLTLISPVILLIILFKSSVRFITNEDKEDAVQDSSRQMAVYKQTSEYEFRYPSDVYQRIVQSIRVVKKPDRTRVRESAPIPLEEIVFVFVAHNGKFYHTRLEDKEEYIKRRLQEESVEHHFFSEVEKFSTLFSAQFDIIVEESGSDFLRAYYLGREILAKKIATGGKKSFVPPQQTPAFNQNL